MTTLSFCSKYDILSITIDEPEAINREAVLIYLQGARDALQSARYNLDGGSYGVAVNRVYYAFFYAVQRYF
jgi:hypothetical protein